MTPCIPGTVAAAMEGYLFGCPSFAFSQVKKAGGHTWDSAVRVAGDHRRRLHQESFEIPVFAECEYSQHVF